MSSLVSESTRRQLSPRQVETVQRLIDATVAELRDHHYDGCTVRKVAERAGVAPATAYTYFGSKDHLITEVFWRRLVALPSSVDRAADSTRSSLAHALSDIALLVADEPELAAACSIAMLASDPDVVLLRDRIGAEMHRRVVDATPDASPTARHALDLLLSGALLHAGMGHLTYDELPDLLATIGDDITRSVR